MDFTSLMTVKKFLLLFCFLHFISAAHAQNITMEETLAYINGKLKDTYTIDVKKGLLLVASFKEGMKLMDETILITDLNPAVIYSEEEKSLILKCKDGDKCVERKGYLVEKKNYFSRVKIVTPPDDKSIKGLQKAFLHMLKLVHEPKYKNAEPFE